jgi:amicoumacin kinase
MPTLPILPGSLAEACSADLSTFTLLGNSQNVVFEFQNRWGEERILRLSAHSHRTDSEIAGELAWVQRLHDQGRRVCPAIPFSDGELIRPLKFGEEPYTAVIFERAKGKPVERSDLGDDLSYRHGEALGSIHAIPFQLVGRKPWPLERYFGPDIEAYVPDPWRATVWDRCRTLLEEAQATTGPIGPLHFDLSYSNLFLDDGRLTVFDFDNCAEGPLVADVAAALYGSIFTAQRRSPGADRSCFAHPQTSKNLESVWTPFVAGYRSQSNWPQEWASQLPIWFQALYLRSVVHAMRLLSPLTPPIAEVLAQDIAHLEAGTMPLNFDFHAGLAID